MKRLFSLLMTIIMISASANAMDDREARREAQYLTDKMAYELGLSQQEYDQVYRINLQYLQNIRTNRDIFASPWQIRNTALRAIFGGAIWNKFTNTTYFYRPIYWERNRYVYRIYDQYPRTNGNVTLYKQKNKYNMPPGHRKHWKKNHKYNDYAPAWNRHPGKAKGHYKYNRW